MAYYFVNPFAVDGDTTAVPDTGAASGAMSWEYGFTPNYELDLSSDPSALPIPRGQMNQVLNTITTEIQNYQQHGVPLWITSADNLGSPYSYDLYARVRYSATPNVPATIIIYENQVQGNTATPGTDSSWLPISGQANGVPTGTIIDFAGVTAPSGYLVCDGSAVSRTTYVNLLSALTQVMTGDTTNASASVINLSSTANMYAGMTVEGTGIQSGTVIISVDSGTAITLSKNATATATGVSLRFYNWAPTLTFSGVLTNASASVTGISTTASLAAGMAVQGYGIPAGTYIASVDSGTAITLSQNATASVTTNLLFILLGNGDGSTTFNVPQLTRRGTIGKGGTPASPVFLGNIIGQVGGEETHVQQSTELAAHTHAVTGLGLTLSGNPVYDSVAGSGGSLVEIIPDGTTGDTVTGTQYAASGNTDSQGSSTAFNVMQFSAVVNKCIKT